MVDFHVCQAHIRWPLETLTFPFPRENTCDVGEGRERILELTEENAIYCGERWKSQKDGLGVCLFPSGDGYAGEWCLNQRHGWGFCIRAYGLKYEGSWSNNKQHGFGVQSQANDMRYMGQFCDGRKHGKGVLLQSNGLLYAGQWEMGEPVCRELLFQSFDTHSRKRAGGVSSDPAGASSSTLHRVHSDDDVSTGPFSKKCASWLSREGSQAQTQSPRLLLNALANAGAGADSDPSASSSSSSSTPIFDSRTNDHESEFPQEDGALILPHRRQSHSSNENPFAKQFKRVQKMSSVSSILDWSCFEVGYFLECCGVHSDICSSFMCHRIGGRALKSLISNANECLGDISIENPYVKRFLSIVIGMLFKIKRRCDAENTMGSHCPNLVNLKVNQISTKGLFLERRIGEGGYGRVYKGKYEFRAEAPTSSLGGSSASSQTSSHRASHHSAHTSTHDAGANSSQYHSSADKHARDGSIPVAVKVFRSRVSGASRLRRLQDGSVDFYARMQRQQKALVRDFFGELKILSQLRHPNITLLLGAVTFPLFCIVTEYVPCGSLFDLLHRHNRSLSLDQLVRIGKEIACALAYVHSKDILHCDLKSSNILLNEMGSVKICDFGLAASFDNEEGYWGTNLRRKPASEDGDVGSVLLGCVGTHQWMAPEVMRGEASTKASDVYSFGVILWEMMTRQIPYRDMALTHIVAWAGYGGMGPYERSTFIAKTVLSPGWANNGVQRQAAGVLPDETSVFFPYSINKHSAMDSLPPPLKALVMACLQQNPERRPSFYQLSKAFNSLHKSAVLDVEENLRCFFGLNCRV
eukprot:Gregarina_sp_Poly_1__6998@NODE_380_length_9076_cov_204_162726_g313_i0_p1_GENE_NODE_380_length_9076_cov_204_162726_g313_i0NODE_380_length_9076_cov_204_162726_g313_i0_p1_ORF_typecomplete_len810_score106_59Pkinase_Tyr/PF07714_17/2_3e62Pkinase/PF00069_25/5_6Pkinase/PF00069_25/3_1e54MORN/PF02493_20/16MORN/PF02493_20/1_4MORN/PF02493_20/0_00024MORN/PF02493_20/0_0087MORN/PF02493_20/1_6e03Kinaselike/PF14531_6/4_1e10Pkinase_fungal/PF17667_1/1_2e03Pkinase_fungal/PF17667_1/1_4e08Kdo/PF06293_14/9_3e09RIO1/PF